MIASSGHSDNECLALRGRLNVIVSHFESWPDEIGWSLPLSYSRFRYRGENGASASNAARRRPPGRQTAGQLPNRPARSDSPENVATVDGRMIRWRRPSILQGCWIVRRDPKINVA